MYRDSAVILYLAVINIVAFVLYGSDKKRAKQNVWRISERTLLFIALLGGSVGAFWGCGYFGIRQRRRCLI